MSDGLPPVYADLIQIQQVIVNVARNALEAMSLVESPSSGITIRTSRNAKAQVEVTISDCGPLLSSDEVDKFFGPFYTTKPEGLGMGVVDQPFDHRSSWQPPDSDAEFRRRSDVSFRAAAQ